MQMVTYCKASYLLANPTYPLLKNKPVLISDRYLNIKGRYWINRIESNEIWDGVYRQLTTLGSLSFANEETDKDCWVQIDHVTCDQCYKTFSPIFTLLLPEAGFEPSVLKLRVVINFLWGNYWYNEIHKCCTNNCILT